MSLLNPRKTVYLQGDITHKNKSLKIFLSDKHINLSVGLWQLTISQIICIRNDKLKNNIRVQLSCNHITGFVSNHQGQSEKNVPVLKIFLMDSSHFQADLIDKFFLINNPSDELIANIDISSQDSLKEYSFHFEVIVDFQRIK